MVSIDWQAVERDFRTGRFTLRELGEKYRCTHAAVGKRARKEGWKQDLSSAVRSATNAGLIEAAVAAGFQKTTDTVLAAAELNKSVILSHRNDVREMRDDVFMLLSELRSSMITEEERARLVQILAGENPDAVDSIQARQLVSKFASVGNRVASVKLLVDAMAKLQIAERIAFSLDEKGEEKVTPLGEALKTFVAQLHAESAGHIPVVPHAQIRRIK